MRVIFEGKFVFSRTHVAFYHHQIKVLKKVFISSCISYIHNLAGNIMLHIQQLVNCHAGDCVTHYSGWSATKYW